MCARSQVQRLAHNACARSAMQRTRQTQIPIVIHLLDVWEYAHWPQHERDLREDPAHVVDVVQLKRKLVDNTARHHK
jgi:hypothetical protein